MTLPTYDFVELNGTTIHYQDVGSGAAIVLLHSGVSDLRFWDDQMEAFTANHRVVRFDQRGSGYTPYPAVPFSYFDDVRALLDYLGIEQAAVVACSFSGRTAIDFALSYPERITALVTVCGVIGGYEFELDDVARAETAARDAAIGAAYDAGDLATCAEIMAHRWFDGQGRSAENGNPAIRQRAVAMLMHMLELPEEAETEIELDPPAFGRLEQIAVPTLAIAGALDEPRINTQLRIVADRVPNARLVVIEGTAHYPNMEKSAEFNRLVLEFLDQ